MTRCTMCTQGRIRLSKISGIVFQYLDNDATKLVTVVIMQRWARPYSIIETLFYFKYEPLASRMQKRQKEGLTDRPAS